MHSQLPVESQLNKTLSQTGHCLHAMYTIDKDCLLHCSEHPLCHRARQLPGKSQAYPTQPQYVMDTHHPQQLMRSYQKHYTVKTTRSHSILRLPPNLKDNQDTMT